MSVMYFNWLLSVCCAQKLVKILFWLFSKVFYSFCTFFLLFRISALSCNIVRNHQISLSESGMWGMRGMRGMRGMWVVRYESEALCYINYTQRYIHLFYLANTFYDLFHHIYMSLISHIKKYNFLAQLIERV